MHAASPGITCQCLLLTSKCSAHYAQQLCGQRLLPKNILVLYLEISANLVASLSLTFLLTRSSMMSQMLYVHDITLHMQHSGMHKLPIRECRDHQHSRYRVALISTWLQSLIHLPGLC